MSTPSSRQPRFAVLRDWQSGTYVTSAGLAMMGDNIEHVISYWVLWETFQSPALVGFQLLSHWLPFLLLSVYAGALAERFDCRKLIQISQGMFIGVSVAWAVLFATGTLSLWSACVLLIIHGIAGTLWAPAEQMMLYDFVGPKTLPSAVRINATFRSLGVLFGPVI
ncbi:MAG TPA: MFS transporter, partial [Beutenbergiaceae bacterium]|nr:MFS transporter [Beutenbergiaceae bacterium]